MNIKKLNMLSRNLKEEIKKEGYKTYKKITLKDLRILIKCFLKGDYKEVFETKLYNNFSGEYCSCLSILNIWEHEGIIKQCI